MSILWQLISQIIEYREAIVQAFLGLVLDVDEGCPFEGLGVIFVILAFIYAITNIVFQVLQSSQDRFCQTISWETLKIPDYSLSSTKALVNGLPYASTSCWYASRIA